MKTVLITGVSRGIGKALAQRFLIYRLVAYGIFCDIIMKEVFYENKSQNSSNGVLSMSLL